ncbi:NADPH-dependent alkenal/one oxidoreductase [Cladobotryum mycophilum]|uniref:NADPH-dependent alkenal/one oxidoreductase n=1 Tax=Cladobotryum mycophilum TaxID=491253 RepID=A0ABR0SK44_9HYPO
MTEIPATMRSLVAPRKCGPEGYEIQELPVPRIALPTQVLIRIHYAGINTSELQLAADQMGIIYKPQYPHQVGLEGAGVIVAVGPEVKNLKVGDEVYGMYVDKPMFRTPPPGFASEYAVAEERFLLLKPSHLSFEDAASLSAMTVATYQALRRGLQLMGEESLEGKTLYVPGGLSSSGCLTIQLARNVFGVSHIISTVSSPKIPLVEKYLPGMIDVLIDYQTQKLHDVVPKHSVDFVLNTQPSTFDEGIPLLKPDTGVLISLNAIPTRETAKAIIGEDRFSWWIGLALDLAQLIYKWKLRGTSIKYEFVSGGVEIREDLEKAGEFIALGKVRPVKRTADLNDIEAVREGCNQVFTGKGGTGKFVLKIV